MAFLFKGIANAALYVAPPIFEVDIDTSDTDDYTIAGNRTKICTISVRFPNNFWLNDFWSEIDSLRPSIHLENSKSEFLCNVGKLIQLGEDHRVSEKEVRFDVYLRVTSADTYEVHFKFSRLVLFLGQKTVRCTVRPANPRSIELIRKEPVPGHGKGHNIYRGGKVRFFLKVKDKHLNTCESDLTFKLTQTTDSVILVSSKFDDWSSHHVVTIRCDQTGMASFGLSLPTAVFPRLQVKVIPPPVSASKSFVPNLDEIESMEHVAGVPFKVKLVLLDVFGNVIPYEERENHIEQVDMRIENEEPVRRKTTKLGQNSNQCELEVTPFRAGIRMPISLSIANEIVNSFPIRCTVRPAEPRSIELIRKEPVPGHGEGHNIYRGGKVRFFLKVKHEHLNTCESDLTFTLTQTTDSVTLVSSKFDGWSSHHVVTVRCDQTGMASFGLSLPTASFPRLQVKVIPPPVSASKSFVPNLDEIESMEHVAGVPLKVKLVLLDVFGNVIPYEERENHIEQVDMRIENEGPVRRRITKLGKNSNECELDVTSFRAGIRMPISLSIANEIVNGFPIPITVVPGPLAEIKITSHDPFAADNEIVSYPTEQRAVIAEGRDEHGNLVPLDPKTCHLEISGEALQNPIVFDGTTYEFDDSKITFSYTFERSGTHYLTIKDASKLHVKVPSFVIQVTRPPIDLGRCEAKVCQEEPIFTGKFRPLQLQLLLYDCTKGKYEIEDDEIPNLNMEVDSMVCHHTVRHGNQPNELFFVLDQIEEGGKKSIKVMYKGEYVCSLEAHVVDVIPYNEKEYIHASIVDANSFDEEKFIKCVGVSRKFILGEDYANINNIQRVLYKNYPTNLSEKDLLSVIDKEAKHQEIFLHPNYYSSTKFSEVVKLLSLLVKGAQHYRGQARQFDRKREVWKAKATNQYKLGNHEKAKECKAIKEQFGKLMDESNKLASAAIFEFYNYDRRECEIDLHGQLVADEDQLQDYRRQLLRKKNATRREVDGIIERERHEGDEAIRLLEKRLATLRNTETRPSEYDWLEIIDGAGHHSKEGQKIRPKVEKFLNEKGEEFQEANKGALLITFSEYTGREPCYANFYCKKCKKAWVSHTSWKGYFQQCYRCDSNRKESRCLPFKLRSVNDSSWRRPYRKETSATFFTNEDHFRLCQKCQELGRDCSKGN